jgi:hypothetical protein
MQSERGFYDFPRFDEGTDAVRVNLLRIRIRSPSSPIETIKSASICRVNPERSFDWRIRRNEFEKNQCISFMEH